MTSVHIADRVARSEDYEPFLWGRNRYARLGRVEVLGGAYRSGRQYVDVRAYSAGRPDADSPCSMSMLTPDQARELAAALIAEADRAEAHR